MKKMLWIVWFVIYSTGGFADVIELRSDLWCPYSCDPKTERPGFMVEIAKEIFEKAGHKVNYKSVNWARAIAETREGKIHGIIGASRADAPDFIIPKRPQGQSTNFYWANHDERWEYKKLDSVKGKKIGVINSYSYSDEIDQAIHDKNPSFVIVSGEDALAKMIRMTEAKRLDAFIENPYVLNYWLKGMRQYNEKFKKVSKNITVDSDLFVAFSPINPNSKKYAEILSQGMDDLRKNGKLQIILQKYGLTDWK